MSGVHMLYCIHVDTVVSQYSKLVQKETMVAQVALYDLRKNLRVLRALVSGRLARVLAVIQHYLHIYP